LHTALKIAPVYRAPVVHLKDASQNAGVAAHLMNKHGRVEFVGKLNEDYQALREKHTNSLAEMVSLEEARKHKLKLF
jgi:5-methyltetrahydrofolate--homocysteine methyltransferase